MKETGTAEIVMVAMRATVEEAMKIAMRVTVEEAMMNILMRGIMTTILGFSWKIAPKRKKTALAAFIFVVMPSTRVAMIMTTSRLISMY